MKDRVVQFPHRYRMVPIAGQSGVYDFEPVTGVVTEVGTPINKATLLSDDTALKYGLNGSNATVDDLFNNFPFTSSYMAFCGNVNADMLDASFGKGNEDRIFGLGRQLAMYAWFKGDSKEVYPFTNLILSNSLNDCFTSGIEEVLSNENILNLILASPFAKAVFIYKLNDYYTVNANSICENDTKFKSLCLNIPLCIFSVESSAFRLAMYNNATITEPTLKNSTYNTNMRNAMLGSSRYLLINADSGTVAYDGKCFALNLSGTSYSGAKAVSWSGFILPPTTITATGYDSFESVNKFANNLTPTHSYANTSSGKIFKI